MRIAELGAPVSQLSFFLTRLEPITLPNDIIRELDRQRLQPFRARITFDLIKMKKLLDQYASGYAVPRDVVENDPQHMVVVTELPQHGSHRGLCIEHEWSVREAMLQSI
ncbi:hypothetical protein A8B73_00500 [Methylosinus sp. 3S-1]|nr:hypothetical protein A8B73_00500 [Methylosinus sp. 3S-1]